MYESELKHRKNTYKGKHKRNPKVKPGTKVKGYNF